MLNVPLVETERLILRGPRPEDFPCYAAMWGDSEVTRFIGGAPLSDEDAWAKFMRAFGHWALVGYGFWTVEEKGSGARLGEIGFLDVHRDISPSLNGIPEVGWALCRAGQGKGYATEAVRGVLGWGEQRFGKVRFACIIAPQNTASLNVAAKTGFRQVAHTTYKGDPTVVLYREP